MASRCLSDPRQARALPPPPVCRSPPQENVLAGAAVKPSHGPAALSGSSERGEDEAVRHGAAAQSLRAAIKEVRPPLAARATCVVLQAARMKPSTSCCMQERVLVRLAAHAHQRGSALEARACTCRRGARWEDVKDGCSLSTQALVALPASAMCNNVREEVIMAAAAAAGRLRRVRGGGCPLRHSRPGVTAGLAAIAMRVTRGSARGSARLRAAVGRNDAGRRKRR
jgi:hypothetical protein